MKKLADLITFLFLSSLIIGSGLTMIIVQAETGDGSNSTGDTQQNPANTIITGGNVQTTVEIGGAYQSVFTATNTAGLPFSFNIQNKPAWANFNQITQNDAILTAGDWSLAQSGTYSNIVVTVTNGEANAIWPPFNITVTEPPLNTNRAPTITINPVEGVEVGTVILGGVYDVYFSGSDQDGDALTFTIENKPIWATFNPQVSAPPYTGQYGARLYASNWNAAQPGIYHDVKVKISDGNATGLVTFDIAVLPPSADGDNQLPHNTGPVPELHSYEGQNAQFNLQNFFSDPDGDPLSFSLVAGGTTASLPEGLTLSPSGTIGGTPLHNDATSNAPNGTIYFYPNIQIADTAGGSITHGIVITLTAQSGGFGNSNSNGNSNENTNNTNNSNSSGDTSNDQGQYTPPNFVGTVMALNAPAHQLTILLSEANAANNVWIINVANQTAISKNGQQYNASGQPYAFNDITANSTVIIFGIIDYLAQQVNALVIDIIGSNTNQGGSGNIPPPPGEHDTGTADENGEPPAGDEGVPNEQGTQGTGNTQQPSQPPSASTFALLESAPATVRRQQAYCLEQGIIDSIKCEKFLSFEVDESCREANISDGAECDTFLKRRHLANLCDTTGATGDLCETEVMTKIENELICEGGSGAECSAAAHDRFVGSIALGIRNRNRITTSIESNKVSHASAQELIALVNKDTSSADAVPATDILPISSSSEKTFAILPSEQKVAITSPFAAQVTVPYVAAYDRDRDGLPDDLEPGFGTDADSDDSDEDGFSDLDELRNGYDPSKPGGIKLSRQLSDIETAFINKVVLEQPVSKGSYDPALTAAAAERVAEKKDVILSGRAEANSFVLIYIYSQMPLVLTARTDEYGNWTYTLTDTLAEGKHTVYVTVTDRDGKISKKSRPLAFFVRAARAVTLTEILEEEPIAAGTSVSPWVRYYIIGGILLMTIGLASSFFIVRRRHQYA